MRYVTHVVVWVLFLTSPVLAGGNDCNNNGVDDATDIADFTSPDCNANGIPDECEIHESSPAPGGPFFCNVDCDPDCNDTGVPDACELAGNDCNADGRPDECGVLDECVSRFGAFPNALNSNAAVDSGDDEPPHIATDRQGTWITVWASFEGLGGLAEDRDILFSRSEDLGATWSPSAPLNDYAAIDGHYDYNPFLVADGSGTWVAVWDGVYDLGGAIDTDNDVFFARSVDNGVTWSAAASLYADTASDTGTSWDAEVASDGMGTWVTVWVSTNELGLPIGDDSDIHVATSHDNGVTWGPAAPLNSNAGIDIRQDEHPVIATDGLGTWLVAWMSREGTTGEYDIHFATSSDNGMTWTDAAALNTNPAGEDIFVRIATDRQGTWLAVWESDGDLGGTIGSDSDILFARSADNALTWSAPAALNSYAASDIASTGDGSPDLATDGHGQWVAVWQSSYDLDGTIDDDADLLFSRSTDNGVQWSAPALANENGRFDNSPPRKFDTNPSLATDESGNWLLAWESDDPLDQTIGTDTDILFAANLTFANDCNCNGRADPCDIDEGTSPDCDDDRVPDECQIDENSGAAGGPFFCAADCDPDCNDDGVPDACNLSGNDCDTDGIPDDCEADDDGDLIPNDCDRCPGFDDSLDGDGDSVPDDCDACPGFDDNLDDDGDGVPDGCDVCPNGSDTEDSDGDGIFDGCDICPGGDDNSDSDGDGIPDACDPCDEPGPCIVSPILAAPPHNVLKNRYISIDPRGEDGANVGGLPFDIRVRLSSTLVNGVTEVGSHWWAGVPDTNCISLVGSTQPASPPNWVGCPTLHLTGCPIMPSSTYEIVAVVEGLLSGPPLAGDTQARPSGSKWWADVVGTFDPVIDAWTPPNGVVSADDVVAAIKTFQNPSLTTGCGTPPCNATHVSVTDVHPAGFPQEPWGTPNRQVDTNDIFAIILGFQGREYPGPEIQSCPDP